MAETSKKPTDTKPYPVWLCVFEVAYADIPTRFPGKPHVKVDRKTIKPGPDLQAWLQRAKSGKHPELVRILESEMPAEHEPGGLHKPFEYPRDQKRIQNALRDLREKLRCDGYTIGKKIETWSVYVIRLKDDHILNRPPGYRGLVYVGQTGLAVEERVRQHRLGEAYPWKDEEKHSPDCHKYFDEYAPELVLEKYRKPIPCRKHALWAERDLRLYLIKAGYEVIGGTDLLKKKKKPNPDATK